MSTIIIDSRGALFGSFTRAPWVTDFDDTEKWPWPTQYTAARSATYDSEGPKMVPHVCLSCHGGHYDSSTGYVVGATLLPIDPGLVQVHGDPTTGNLSAALEQIRQINLIILASNPAPAVTQYINGLYSGHPNAPANPGAPPFVPSGWSQESSLYLNVM